MGDVKGNCETHSFALCVFPLGKIFRTPNKHFSRPAVTAGMWKTSRCITEALQFSKVMKLPWELHDHSLAFVQPTTHSPSARRWMVAGVDCHRRHSTGAPPLLGISRESKGKFVFLPRLKSIHLSKGFTCIQVHNFQQYLQQRKKQL